MLATMIIIVLIGMIVTYALISGLYKLDDRVIFVFILIVTAAHLYMKY